MTGPQLRAWRISHDYSLRDVASLLKDTTHPTLSRWESSDDHIPAWAEDILLSATKVELPLGELQALLDLARRQNMDFRTLLGLAITEFLASQERPVVDYTQAAARGTAAMRLNEAEGQVQPMINEGAVDDVLAHTAAMQRGEPVPPGYVAVPLETATTEEAAAIRAAIEAKGGAPSVVPVPVRRKPLKPQ